MYFDSFQCQNWVTKEYQVGDCLIKSKRRPKIGAYGNVFFEYKRMRLFLSVYSIGTKQAHLSSTIDNGYNNGDLQVTVSWDKPSIINISKLDLVTMAIYVLITTQICIIR